MIECSVHRSRLKLMTSFVDAQPMLLCKNRDSSDFLVERHFCIHEARNTCFSNGVVAIFPCKPAIFATVFTQFTNLVLAEWCYLVPNVVAWYSSMIDGQANRTVSVRHFFWTVTYVFLVHGIQSEVPITTTLESLTIFIAKFAEAYFLFLNGRCHLKRSMPFFRSELHSLGLRTQKVAVTGSCVSLVI